MHTWEITHLINNLKSLANAMRVTANKNPDETDPYTRGIDKGLLIAAKSIEKEITSLENRLKEREQDAV